MRELALFGSATSTDFQPASDYGFLVRFAPDAEKPWLGHFRPLAEDLSSLLGRDVDLVPWRALEESRNWIRRRNILESAQTLYAA